MSTLSTRLFTLLVLYLAISFAERQNLSAQNTDSQLQINTGLIALPENVLQYDQMPLQRNEELEGERYLLVQFYQLPDARQRQSLKDAGLHLLDYWHQNTYSAALSTQLTAAQLKDMGLRSIVPIPAFAKWDPRLDELLGSGNKLVEVILLTQKKLPEDRIRAYLTQDGIKIIHGQNRLWKVQISPEQLQHLPELPYICWIEPVPERGEPEDIRGRSLLRANAIDGLLPSSYHFDGSGVAVLVRDDGAIGPHIDYQGRLHNAPGFAAGGTHADGVGGILAGAGNLDPYMRGMAAGAEVYAIPYQADFLDNTLDLHIQEGILVTNSSYSNGCNDGYTAITQTVDQQMYDYPTFLHVFSAGNSNGQNCDYGAGNQWGNITGGHKQGKNVITTANLYQNGELVQSSSRGPAHDGRIKPDIAANGAGHFSTAPHNEYQEFGGTSGASPCVAGIIAQLHQAYQSWHGGDIAPAALLKTIVLNTATDLGNPGPDFKFGWGQINALRALRTLEEERHTGGSLDQGESFSHILNIPADVAQAKVMLYWADAPAMPNALTALINDLDLTIESPDGIIYHPYVLDHTPNPALLDLPAGTGEDHLNNMEQVAIDNPQPGNWTIHINGTSIPQGPQQFYISWDFLHTAPELTFPNGGEGFVPGSTRRIHWDAYGNDGAFQLDFSPDSGATWLPLATVNADMRMYDWVVPSEITGKAQIRIARNGQSHISEAFSIIGTPENLQVTMACPDSLHLTWNTVQGAEGYDIFLLGDKYMDSIAHSTTNSISIATINGNPSLNHWIAVRAITPDGTAGQRSIAIPYQDGLLNCTLNHDLELTYLHAPSVEIATGCTSFDSEVRVQLTNNGQNPIQDITLFYQLNNLAIVEETPASFFLEPGQSMEYIFNTPLSITTNDEYELKVWGSIADDEAGFNDTLSHQFSLNIYPGTGASPGYTEDFESAGLPTYWSIANPDLSITWELRDDIIGSDGNPTQCYFLNNYSYSDSGQEDALITLPLDLTSLSPEDHVAFSFDLAYAYYNSAYFDALRIDVYTDCGSTFAGTIYYKEGSELQTDPPTNSVYAPSGADSWRKELINLDDFKGESVVLRLVNITGYGNSIYIDNVALVTGQPPVAGFLTSSSSVCQGSGLLILDASTGEDLSYSWEFGIGASPSTASGAGPYAVIYTIPGPTVISLTVSNGFGESAYQQVITVLPPASAAFSYTYQGNGQYQFTNNSVSANSVLWDFGDGTTSTDASPLHQYQQAGTYTVSLSIEGDCGEDETSQQIDVITSVQNPISIRSTLHPNPNSGQFVLRVATSTPWSWSITDLQGRLLQQSDYQLQQETQINSPLPAGVYLLQIQLQSGEKTVKRMVILK